MKDGSQHPVVQDILSRYERQSSRLVPSVHRHGRRLFGEAQEVIDLADVGDLCLLLAVLALLLVYLWQRPTGFAAVWLASLVLATAHGVRREWMPHHFRVALNYHGDL